MRSQGWGLDDRTGALARRGRDVRGIFFTTGEHGKEAAIRHLRKSSLQNPICWHPCLGLPSLQNCEKVFVCYLSHPACGILWWPPQDRLIQRVVSESEAAWDGQETKLGDCARGWCWGLVIGEVSQWRWTFYSSLQRVQNPQLTNHVFTCYRWVARKTAIDKMCI